MYIIGTSGEHRSCEESFFCVRSPSLVMSSVTCSCDAAHGLYRVSAFPTYMNAHMGHLTFIWLFLLCL